MLNSATTLARSHIPFVPAAKPPPAPSSSRARSRSCNDLNDHAFEAVIFLDVGGFKRDEERVLINYRRGTIVRFVFRALEHGI
jgi:hypothetical protein